MDSKKNTEMNLALFIEDSLLEESCLEIVDSINDVEDLWTFGEMTL